MNGPSHYREAERMIALADSPAGTALKLDGIDAVALAQVHATLALTAATAEPIAQSYDGPDDTTIPRAWSEAIS